MSKGMQQSYVSSYMKTVNEKNMSTYYIFQFFILPTTTYRVFIVHCFDG